MPTCPERWKKLRLSLLNNTLHFLEYNSLLQNILISHVSLTHRDHNVSQKMIEAQDCVFVNVKLKAKLTIFLCFQGLIKAVSNSTYKSLSNCIHHDLVSIKQC